MAVRQWGKVWAAGVVAVLIQAWAPASAGASWEVPACGEAARLSAGVRKVQPEAVSRTGRIPALGRVAATIGWDGQQELTLAGGGFQATRRYSPLTREVEITVSGSGEAALVVRFGGLEGFSVTRGTEVVRGTADADAIRSLVDGRAVAAFRGQIGNYERYLIAGAGPARFDDVHADGFLLAGAFLGSLAGDPTSLGRARDLIMRRIRGKFRAVRFEFRNCVTEYERYLLMIDEQRTDCLDAAEDRDSWYARAADRLGCEIEFMAGAIAGEGQFIGCTSLGAIL